MMCGCNNCDPVCYESDDMCLDCLKEEVFRLSQNNLDLVREKQPTAVTLYRYTFKSGDDICQTLWTTETFESYVCNYYKPSLLKTETKEVGLD